LALLREALGDAYQPGTRAKELGELRARTHDGRDLEIDARHASIQVEEGRAALLSLRDVTRQKQLERELQVRDRLSSIGLLTAGVTHEINNPLEGIGNYLMLAERAKDDAVRRAHLEQVRHGFDRIRDLVRDLLRFARPDPGSTRADLVEVVERAISLTAYTGRFKDVALSRVCIERPILVLGDPARLEQVVLNL